jgi:hypothetical protein
VKSTGHEDREEQKEKEHAVAAARNSDQRHVQDEIEPVQHSLRQ